MLVRSDVLETSGCVALIHHALTFGGAGDGGVGEGGGGVGKGGGGGGDGEGGGGSPYAGGGSGEGGGGGGDGGEGDASGRGPQSAQSLPYAQLLSCAPGPPSLQTLLLLDAHEVCL